MKAPFLLLVLLHSLQISAARIEALGFLPDRPGATHATAISADGSTVVGYCELIENHSYSQRAFLWRKDSGMQDLGTIPHPTIPADSHNQSAAFALSADGSIVVGESNFQPFRWTAATLMQLAHPVPEGQSGAEAVAISANGETIFFRTYGNASGRSYLLTSANAFVEIPELSQIFGCSPDGAYLVGEGRSLGFDATRWNRSTGSQLLGDFSPCTNPDYHGSIARAVSADGNVVVGDSYPMFGSCAFFDEMWEAFRWTPANGLKRLGGIGTNFVSSAFTVSADGKIAAGTLWYPSAQAILWNESDKGFLLWDILAARGVDLSYWKQLNAIHSISTNALFLAGHGINTNNVKEAFLVELDDLHFGPSLELSTSQSGLSISWANAYSSMRLVFTESLNPPITWLPVTNQVQSADETQTVHLQNLADSRRFYRLFQ